MRNVETYERLHNLIKLWKVTPGSFLTIVGAAGLGKTHAYETALKDTEYNLFKGRTTALAIYQTVHDRPEIPIVFDDVNSMLKDATTLELMKAICDTRPERVVQWNRWRDFADNTSKEFRTSANVLLLTNRNFNPQGNDDIVALLDRADCVHFCPDKTEVMRYLASYASDKEVLRFLKTVPAFPSLRTYEKALQWKTAIKHKIDIDWKAEVLAECQINDAVSVLVNVLETMGENTQMEQVNAWQKITLLPMKEFYKHLDSARKLLEAKQIEID